MILPLLLAAALSSSTNDTMTCKVPHPGQQAVFKIAALPPRVRAALGPMADPGQPFSFTDVIEYDGHHQMLPTQQLIYADHRHEGWIIYSIQGGYAPECSTRLVWDDGRTLHLAKPSNTTP